MSSLPVEVFLPLFDACMCVDRKLIRSLLLLNKRYYCIMGNYYSQFCLGPDGTYSNIDCKIRYKVSNVVAALCSLSTVYSNDFNQLLASNVINKPEYDIVVFNKYNMKHNNVFVNIIISDNLNYKYVNNSRWIFSGEYTIITFGRNQDPSGGTKLSSGIRKKINKSISTNEIVVMSTHMLKDAADRACISYSYFMIMIKQLIDMYD